jgi:hypothetical protein
MWTVSAAQCPVRVDQLPGLRPHEAAIALRTVPGPVSQAPGLYCQ